MIEKIISIKNVGKFEDYSAAGDVTFRGLTLMYGGNASGKTTLSAIFRSLQTGEAPHIEERQRLAARPEPPSVQLRAEGRTFTYQDGAWSEPLPKIEIFDERFVTENVYSGDAIEPEHRHNLHRFAIGEEAVRLATDIDALADEIQGINTEIRGTEHSVRSEVLGTMAVEEFVALEAVEDIDSLISYKQQELDGLTRAGEIAEKEELAAIDLPAVQLDDLRALLAKTLPDVSAEAERQVRQHLDGCTKDGDEAWVSQGMTYIKDDLCPFCGQPLSGVELIAAYRDYFSETYDAFKVEIQKATSKTQETLSEAALLGLQGSINANLTLGQFWKDHVNSEAPNVAFDEIKPVWSRLRECLVANLEKKAAAPLEKVPMSDEVRKAQAGFEQVRGQVSAYNKKVCGINEAITTKKAQASSGSLPVVETELTTRKNTKRRHEEPVAKMCSKYLGLKKEKKDLEADKEKQRKSLEKQTQDLLTQYEERINRCLARFGADFSLIQTGERFYGGTARIEYGIAINGERVELAAPDGSQSRPSFSNTLSSGDKTTLALAFFLARLEREEELAEKIIILDDPVSSLDSHRRSQTRQEIARLASHAEQVIVLSHDPYFLRLVWDSWGASQTKTLCAQRSGAGNVIVEWNIERETAGEYLQNYRLLEDYLENGPPDDDQSAYLRKVAQCIRPLLEENLRIRFPGRFPRNMWLGEMIGEIGRAGEGSILAVLNPLKQELSEINDYSKDYHHGQNANAHTHPITDPELKPHVLRTLKVISGVLAVAAPA